MNLKILQSASLLISMITTGLIAGLMFAFACAIMPGLNRSSDRTYVEAMRNINKAIINGWFMLAFMGSIPVIILALVLAWRGYGRAALPWIAVALVLYLVAFFITMGANVPLNDQLEKAGNSEHLKDITAARHAFHGTWMAWHLVRTLFHIAALACLGWALVVHGGDRDRPHAAAEPPGARAYAPPAAGPYGPPGSH
jgi:uncharacterized membrane protein